MENSIFTWRGRKANFNNNTGPQSQHFICYINRGLFKINSVLLLKKNEKLENIFFYQVSKDTASLSSALRRDNNLMQVFSRGLHGVTFKLSLSPKSQFLGKDLFSDN